ncbi:hypothetical protein [Umezawaea beigongshangensis]|uniref:hypothetical protein n=1 Tax=Umezawaea beigongshangensis TaxID=2780383 RepID=UPI0018F24FD5|nr:hypothetical protein [Umezawaea beigongshangensis]
MPQSALPATGTEFVLRCHAPETAVTVRAKPVLVDFTGECTVQVRERSGDGGTAVELRVLALSLSAELPDAGGSEDGGTVVLEQDDTSGGDSGTVRLVGDRYEVRLVTGLAMTLRQPGGTVRLTARGPVELTADAAHFPPRADGLALTEPVRFVLGDNDDVTPAQIDELVVRLDEV